MNRVLLIRFSSMGDIVRFLPIPWNLKQRWPHVEIDWITDQAYASLVTLSPSVDHILCLDRKKETWGSLALSPRSLRKIQAWRRRKYDVIFDLHQSLLSQSVSLLFRGSQRVGFSKKNELGFGLFQTPSRKELLRPEDFYLQPLQAVGVEGKAVYDLRPGASTRERVRGWLHSHALAPGGFLCVHPFSSQATKVWDLVKYAEVASSLQRDLGLKIVWVAGNEQERRRLRGLKGVVYRGDYPELAGLFQWSAGFLGGESGPFHLADALGVKSLALFGPSDPRNAAPYGRQSAFFRKEVACSPCYRGIDMNWRCQTGTSACLREMEVFEVKRYFDKWWVGNAAGTSTH